MAKLVICSPATVAHVRIQTPIDVMLKQERILAGKHVSGWNILKNVAWKALQPAMGFSETRKIAGHWNGKLVMKQL